MEYENFPRCENHYFYVTTMQKLQIFMLCLINSIIMYKYIPKHDFFTAHWIKKYRTIEMRYFNLKKSYNRNSLQKITKLDQTFRTQWTGRSWTLHIRRHPGRHPKRTDNQRSSQLRRQHVGRGSSLPIPGPPTFVLQCPATRSLRSSPLRSERRKLVGHENPQFQTDQIFPSQGSPGFRDRQRFQVWKNRRKNDVEIYPKIPHRSRL